MAIPTFLKKLENLLNIPVAFGGISGLISLALYKSAIALST